jgi:hypothetical protein
MLPGVLDANAVIGLAHGGVFHLLAFVYRTIYLPPAVKDEMLGPGAGRTHLRPVDGPTVARTGDEIRRIPQVARLLVGRPRY